MAQSTETSAAVNVTIGPEFIDVPPLPLEKAIKELEANLKKPELGPSDHQSQFHDRMIQ